MWLHKMDDASTQVYGVTCEDWYNVTKSSNRQNIENALLRDLPNPVGTISKISHFESIPLITFVPVQV